MIDYTTQNIGTSELLKACLQTSNTNHVLKEVIKAHNVDDLRQVLIESLDDKTYGRADLIQNLVVPLVESPKDLHPYLKSLSVQQLGDILMENVPNTEYDQLLRRLLKGHVNGIKDSLTVQICKKDLLSSSDLLQCFKSCLIQKNEEEKHDIQIEMFKFISEQLTPETLLNLHVDFLQRIKNTLSNQDK